MNLDHVERVLEVLVEEGDSTLLEQKMSNFTLETCLLIPLMKLSEDNSRNMEKSLTAFYLLTVNLEKLEDSLLLP